MYILIFKRAVFRVSVVKITLNLGGGGTSSQGPKNRHFEFPMWETSFDSFGPGVTIRLNKCGGISPERRKVYIISNKLALLVNLE